MFYQENIFKEKTYLENIFSRKHFKGKNVGEIFCKKKYSFEKSICWEMIFLNMAMNNRLFDCLAGSE